MPLSVAGAPCADPWHVDREAGLQHWHEYCRINAIDCSSWHRERPHVRYTPCLRPAGDPWAHRTGPAYTQALRPASEPWGRR